MSTMCQIMIYFFWLYTGKVFSDLQRIFSWLYRDVLPLYPRALSHDPPSLQPSTPLCDARTRAPVGEQMGRAWLKLSELLSCSSYSTRSERFLSRVSESPRSTGSIEGVAREQDFQYQIAGPAPHATKHKCKFAVEICCINELCVCATICH